MIRDGAWVRRERMREILTIIDKNSGITLDKLYSIVMLKIGLTKQTLRRYLNELEDAGLIRQDEYKIFKA